MITGNLMHILNNMIQNMKDLIQLFQIIMKKTQWLNRLKIMQHYLIMLTNKKTKNIILMLSQKTMKHHLLILYNKTWIGEIYYQIICHNYIFNLKWLNLIMISYTNTVPRWISKINNKLNYHQLINGLFITQYYFVTYWLWVPVHHFSTYHARRWNISWRIRKHTNFKLVVCLFWPWNRTRNSRRKLKELCL